MGDRVRSYSTSMEGIARRGRVRALALRVATALCVLVAAPLLTTASALAAAPEAPKAEPPTEVKATTASLNGVLSPKAPGELGSTYQFVYRASVEKECKGAGEVKTPTNPGMSLGAEDEVLPAEPVTGLTANTEYAVCLVAENAAKTERTPSAAVTFKTALPPEKPTTTIPAKEIKGTTAKLEGTLNPVKAGEAGTYEFAYQQSATECAAGAVAPAPPGGTMTGAAKQAVAETVKGLEPLREYTFCLIAINKAGEAASGVLVRFKTLAAPPAVEHEGVLLPVKATEAHLEGTVNPNNQLTECHFQYGEALVSEHEVPCEPELLKGFGPQGVGANVTSLSANTTYHYQIVTKNGTGEDNIPTEETFETALPPETPAMLKAEPVTAAEATLHGALNPGLERTKEPGSYEFRYRQSASECQGGAPGEEKATPATPAPGLEKYAPAEAKVTGLLPHTGYAVCLLAINEAGEVSGVSAPETFTTLSAPPAIAAESFSDVGATEAKAGAEIDPEGLPVSYHVEYGTSEAYGSSTPEVNIPAGQGGVGVEVALSKLQPDTLYHYRFVATTSSHETTRDEEDQAFTTLPTPPAPGSEHCPNEALRVGRSASLPDCRAYELVTPTNLGRTEDMLFADADRAIPSSEGEHLALQTGSPIEPEPSTSADIEGTAAVFSRTSSGWAMRSAVAPGRSTDHIYMRLFSPDLSQVALVSYTALNAEEANHNPPGPLEVGPVGGPDALVANLGTESTHFLGANAGTKSVPAFSHVLFYSVDHELLPPGPERTAAEEADAGAPDLYEWNAGSLRLVNVEGEGSHVKLVNPCGATLGRGETSEGQGGTTDAVSADGSRVLFTTKQSGASCEGAPILFMRVDGRETVEVSAPGQPGARYVGATADASKVFFETEFAELFEYNTEAPEGKKLKLVANQVLNGNIVRTFVISEDGSTVYYEAGLPASYTIYRYEPGSGNPQSAVATGDAPDGELEPSYTTPNGEFLLFAAADSSRGEPRGGGHNEFYRYDHADGSVMCVSCGEGVAPARGQMFEPKQGVLSTPDRTPLLIPMSDDGQRVFFQTSAQLVPQDTNVNDEEEEKDEYAKARLGRAADVYEWEADGAEEEPGVFCRVVNGCTHLLSSGEDVGPAVFLGASSSGRDVFFATAAQLVPQATPEFTNIYDAREGGGFPSPASTLECSSCQGVGSPPPLFNTPASASFVGAGNPAAPAVAPIVTVTRTQQLARALTACRKVKPKRKRAVCEKQARKRYGAATAKAKKSGGRASGKGK
jgi:hypothetical protein